MLGDCGFHLHTVGIFPPQKSELHLPPILCLWPFAAVGARIELDDRRPYFQALPRECMIFLAVKTGIAQAGVDLDVAHGVFQQRAPKDAVIAGAARHAGRQDQMRRRVADDSQFGPIALAARFCAYARLVMFAGMAFFKAGGINGGAGGLFKENRRSRPVPEAGRTRRETVS